MAFYTSVGATLLLLIYEKTVPRSLMLGTPLAITTGLLLFMTVFLSIKFEDIKICEHSSPFFFETLTFALSFSVGIITTFVIGAPNWNMWLGYGAFAVICGFSHMAFLDSRKIQKFLRSTQTTQKNYELFSKWLELEHNTAQTAFHWVLWTITVFLTAAVAAYFLSPVQTLELSVLQDVFIIAIWGLIGVWWGILNPILERMTDLMEEIRDAAIKREQSPDICAS